MRSECTRVNMIKSSRIASILLVLSMLFPFTIYFAKAQTSVFSTTTSSSMMVSYSTYSVGATQYISTATSTIFNGNLLLPGWRGACPLITSYQFSAGPGDVISVSFISANPIDIYFMSGGQFANLFRYCRSVFPSISHAAYRTSYSSTWSPVQPGQYFVVLVNYQAQSSPVSLTAEVITPQQVTSAIYDTGTNWFTQFITQTVNYAAATETKRTETTALYSGALPNVSMIIVLVIIVALLFFFSALRKRKRSEKTQVY